MSENKDRMLRNTTQEQDIAGPDGYKRLFSFDDTDVEGHGRARDVEGPDGYKRLFSSDEPDVEGHMRIR